MRKLVTVKFLGLVALSFVALMAMGTPLFAEAAAAAAPAGDQSYKGLIAIAMGLAIGLAAFGGSLGQARAAAAALEGIARNPGTYNKIFVPMILALAFIESLVLYALVIAFTLNGKL
jgi:F-type H+-transporting ATPase subunit c